MQEVREVRQVLFRPGGRWPAKRVSSRQAGRVVPSPLVLRWRAGRANFPPEDLLVLPPGHFRPMDRGGGKRVNSPRQPVPHSPDQPLPVPPGHLRLADRVGVRPKTQLRRFRLAQKT